MADKIDHYIGALTHLGTEDHEIVDFQVSSRPSLNFRITFGELKAFQIRHITAVKDVRDRWQWGGWADNMMKTGNPVKNAQIVTDWLTEQMNKLLEK